MHRTSNTTISDALLGARDMLPMTLAASTYGAAFGILAMKSGFSVSQSLSMSALVFAGSAQLIALDQLLAGAGAGAAIMAGAALNMRMLLVTASMRPALAGRPWWQIIAGVYLATDASVALIQAARDRGSRQVTGISLAAMHPCWWCGFWRRASAPCCPLAFPRQNDLGWITPSLPFLLPFCPACGAEKVTCGHGLWRQAV